MHHTLSTTVTVEEIDYYYCCLTSTCAGARKGYTQTLDCAGTNMCVVYNVDSLVQHLFIWRYIQYYTEQEKTGEHDAC